MTSVQESAPMIESLEPRAFCSVTPMSTGAYSPVQTKPTTTALYIDPKTVQPNVVIAIIAILIG